MKKYCQRWKLGDAKETLTDSDEDQDLEDGVGPKMAELQPVEEEAA
jgi:hypothetical protein